MSLHKAIDDNDIEKVKQLIASNANVSNSELLQKALKSKKLMKLLIEAKADLQHKDLIPHAAFHYSVKTVEFLLDRNADVNTYDHCGRTALWNAVYNDELKMVKFLISRNADVNSVCQDNGMMESTPLSEACSDGSEDMVKFLIRAKADLEVFDDDDDDIIAYACEDQPEISKIIAQAKLCRCSSCPIHCD